MRFGQTPDEINLLGWINQIPVWQQIVICLSRWKYWRRACFYDRVEAALLNDGWKAEAKYVHKVAIHYWHCVYNAPFVAGGQEEPEKK